jgi:hypothetical protein
MALRAKPIMFERWIIAVWLVVLPGGFYWGRKALRHLTPLGEQRRRGITLGSPLWWSAEHYSREGNRYRLLTLLFFALWIAACLVWITSP